jgi:hypothetical protein
MMRGRIRLELTDGTGAVIDVRQADNAVLQSGGTLVAQLFAGLAGARGITHMGVGTSDAPETEAFSTVALANPDGPDKLSGETEAAIPPEAIVVDPPDPITRTVRVRIRATLPATAAVGVVREAGLVSRTAAPPSVLYNRVTFAPLTKGADHELTMFWEVSFPYGDLQELV